MSAAMARTVEGGRAAKSANSRAPSVCGLCKWCVNVIVQHGGPVIHLFIFSPKSLKTTI